MAIPTVDEVVAEIQDLLGDATGKVFTSTVATKGYQRAYRRLRTALVNRQIPYVKKIVTYTLSANTTQLSPETAGISDFGELVELEERASGSTDNYLPMYECEELPQREERQSLYDYTWREDQWWFVGSTENRQLRITYLDSAAPPSSGSVGIDDSLPFLSTYGAATIAPTKGYDERGLALMRQAVGNPTDGEDREGGELLRLVRAQVRSLQKTPIQPKPYGVGLTYRRNVAVPNIAAPPAIGSMTALTFLGTQDGVNDTFTLSGASPSASVIQIFLNGQLLADGFGYTRSVGTVVFAPDYIPLSTDVLAAYA